MKLLIHIYVAEWSTATSGIVTLHQESGSLFKDYKHYTTEVEVPHPSDVIAQLESTKPKLVE